MENLKLDDFIKYKFLSGVRYAPDGRNACFVVHEANLEENKYLSNLWLYKTEEDRYFQLTAFNSETNFIWLGDSRSILFASTRNPKDKEKIESGEEFTRFYKINIYGGEGKEAFCIPKNVRLIKEVDENTYIFTAAYKLNSKEIYLLNPEEKAEELKRRKQEKDYEVLDEIPFWRNGIGFINKVRNRLYLYHLNSGKLEPLTDEYMNVGEFNLDRSRAKVVFTGVSYHDKMMLENDIYLCDLSTKKIKKITYTVQFLYGNPHFIADNKVICSGSDMKRYGIYQDQKFYLINIDSKTIKCLTPNSGYSLVNSVLSDCRYGNTGTMRVDDGYLYFVTTESTYSGLNRINADGNMEKVVTGKGSADDYDIKNGKVLFIGLKEMKLQELYEAKGTGKIRQITHFNEWVQKEKTLAALEKLNVKTEPDVKIDGWVMKPVNFNQKVKYPAILNIHGGPKTIYGEVFFHAMQYWANEGYAVFFCNPRGSDGKGDGFADIRGKYGTIDFDDIMKFTKAVLEKYLFIDPERVGVTGGSYGGFMTNWIIGHTDRFKAAVSQRSISNWITNFTTSDIGYYFVNDQIVGTPWDNPERLWERSPLKYANRVRTPTLFIHSDEDYRCWLVEGIQMFFALKYHGVESRLCLFKGENHNLSKSGKPKHRIRRLEEITSWFNRYLKKYYYLSAEEIFSVKSLEDIIQGMFN